MKNTTAIPLENRDSDLFSSPGGIFRYLSQKRSLSLFSNGVYHHLFFKNFFQEGIGLRCLLREVVLIRFLRFED